eukprot:125610_1
MFKQFRHRQRQKRRQDKKSRKSVDVAARAHAQPQHHHDIEQRPYQPEDLLLDYDTARPAPRRLMFDQDLEDLDSLPASDSEEMYRPSHPQKDHSNSKENTGGGTHFHFDANCFSNSSTNNYFGSTINQYGSGRAKKDVSCGKCLAKIKTRMKGKSRSSIRLGQHYKRDCRVTCDSFGAVCLECQMRFVIRCEQFDKDCGVLDSHIDKDCGCAASPLNEQESQLNEFEQEGVAANHDMKEFWTKKEIIIISSSSEEEDEDMKMDSEGLTDLIPPRLNGFGSQAYDSAFVSNLKAEFEYNVAPIPPVLSIASANNMSGKGMVLNDECANNMSGYVAPIPIASANNMSGYVTNNNMSGYMNSNVPVSNHAYVKEEEFKTNWNYNFHELDGKSKANPIDLSLLDGINSLSL